MTGSDEEPERPSPINVGPEIVGPPAISTPGGAFGPTRLANLSGRFRAFFSARRRVKVILVELGWVAVAALASWGAARWFVGPPSVPFQAQLGFADLEITPGQGWQEWPDPDDAVVSRVTSFEATGKRIDLSPCRLRLSASGAKVDREHCEIAGAPASIRLGGSQGPAGLFRRITPVRGTDGARSGTMRIEATAADRVSFSLRGTGCADCSESIVDFCPSEKAGSKLAISIVGANLTLDGQPLASAEDYELECGTKGASIGIKGLDERIGATLSVPQPRDDPEMTKLWSEPPASPKVALWGRLATDGRITVAAAEFKAYRSQIVTAAGAVISSISWGGPQQHLEVAIGEANALTAGGRPVAERKFWTVLLAVYSAIYSLIQIVRRW